MSYTVASQMISNKSWLKSSDEPVETFKTSKFVKDTRDVFGLQPKIKSMDFTTAHVFGSQRKNEPMDFDDILEKSFYLNPEGISGNFVSVSDQDIPIRDLLVPTAISPKQNYVELENYVEFQQSYMGILNEVKHEAEQARLLDNDIEKIKSQAYHDSDAVIKEIYDVGVSMPEVDWNEDGSINLSWFLKTGGTSTISLYGDDYVIYNTYLEPDNYVRSVCKISDGLLLPKLIGILSNITE